MKQVGLKEIGVLNIGHTVELIGALYSTQRGSLLVPFPGEDIKELDLTTLSMNSEEWIQFLRQSDLLEVEIIEKAADGVLTKAIIRKSQRQIDQVVAWQVFRRDGYQCRYCANDQTPLTVDHLVLWEEGGPTDPANLVAACRKCNKMRGNTQYVDWLNHDYYKRVARNLSADTRRHNVDLAATLEAIPRVVNIRSRGKKKKR